MLEMWGFDLETTMFSIHKQLNWVGRAYGVEEPRKTFCSVLKVWIAMSTTSGYDGVGGGRNGEIGIDKRIIV